MLAGQLCAEGILADAGVNAVYLIGDHGAAVADAVDEDAPVAFALCNRECGGIDKIGKIAGLLIVCSGNPFTSFPSDSRYFLISSFSSVPA